MDYFLTILGMFVSVLLILVILLQRGRGGGLVGALSGLGGQSAFGTKAGDTFTRITIGIAAVWVVLAGISGQVLRSSTVLFRGDEPVSIQSKAKDADDRDAKRFGETKGSKKDSKDATDKESDTKTPLKPEDDSTKDDSTKEDSAKEAKEDAGKETKKEADSVKSDKDAKPEEKPKQDNPEPKGQETPEKDSKTKTDESKKDEETKQ